MNRKKRYAEPLRSGTTRFEQAEDSDLVYTVNWAPCVSDILTSTWTVVDGDLTLSSESIDTTNIRTSVSVTGSPGESILTNTITTTSDGTDKHKLLIKIEDDDVPYVSDDYGYGC